MRKRRKKNEKVLVLQTDNYAIDKMEIYSRIRKLIEALGMSTRQFAMELGYERAEKVYAIVKEKYFPSFETLIDIFNRFPQVNVEWLMTGKGEMFDREKVAPLEEKALEERTSLSTSEKIKLLEAQILDKDKIISLLEQRIRDLEQ